MDLVIFMGLQASGKSTFYHTFFEATHTYVSKDLLRNNKRPAHRQHQLVEDALQASRSVVIDNTNPTVADRAELITLGQQYGAHIAGYYFEVQVRRSIVCNKLRSGKARVPDIAIFSTLKRLVRPSYKEGFDQLYYVIPHEDFRFEMLPWREQETFQEFE